MKWNRKTENENEHHKTDFGINYVWKSEGDARWADLNQFFEETEHDKVFKAVEINVKEGAVGYIQLQLSLNLNQISPISPISLNLNQISLSLNQISLNLYQIYLNLYQIYLNLYQCSLNL